MKRGVGGASTNEPASCITPPNQCHDTPRNAAYFRRVTCVANPTGGEVYHLYCRSELARESSTARIGKIREQARSYSDQRSVRVCNDGVDSVGTVESGCYGSQDGSSGPHNSDSCRPEVVPVHVPEDVTDDAVVVVECAYRYFVCEDVTGQRIGFEHLFDEPRRGDSHQAQSPRGG